MYIDKNKGGNKVKNVNQLSSILYAILISILIINGISYSQNDTWPQFRGPNCSGIADKYSNPPIQFNEKKYRTSALGQIKPETISKRTVTPFWGTFETSSQ